MWQTIVAIGIVALAAIASILYIRRMIQGRSTGCGCGNDACPASGNDIRNRPGNDCGHCVSTACSECNLY